jgi:hypothetical protein
VAVGYLKTDKTMKNKIERILIWLRKGEYTQNYESEMLHPLSVLLTRTINSNYGGKQYKYINIELSDWSNLKDKSLIKDYSRLHYYRGHLRCHEAIDLKRYLSLEAGEGHRYIWELVCKSLKEAALSTKNQGLADATEKAHKIGLRNNLDLNFIILEEKFNIKNNNINVELWFEFDHSERADVVLRIKNNERMIYERKIDDIHVANEFSYTIFKKIVLQDDLLILKGHYEIEYLPLKIPLTKLNI